MTQSANRKRLIGLTVGALLGGTVLTGSLYARTPSPAASVQQAQDALAKGKNGKAITFAEQAVQADPNNAEYRAMLGSAYLKTGRFQSAAAAFTDATALGDTSPRTALSLALALIGAGNAPMALAALDRANDTIAPADLGLAYSLAGDPRRGVAILTDTIRNGENTAKTRQNLAYSLAIAGDWRQARIMASMDVPAEQLGERLSQWAATAQAGAFQQRVASLLNVPVLDKDPGRPEALALNGVQGQPAIDPAAAATPYTAYAPPAPYRGGELPALGAAPAPVPAPVRTAAAPMPVAAPTPAVPAKAAPLMEEAPPANASEPHTFAEAFAPAPQGATPAAAIADTVRFVSQPVVQRIPVNHAAAPTQRMPAATARPAAPRTVAAAAPRGSGTHLVQLGSFLSPQQAQKASGIYMREHRLDSSQIRITNAKVNGRLYWRVSATGLTFADARAMCSSLKARGQECLALG